MGDMFAIIMVYLGTGFGIMIIFAIIFFSNMIDSRKDVSYKKQQRNAYLDSDKYWRDINALDKKIDDMTLSILHTYSRGGESNADKTRGNVDSHCGGLL